jgi:hypothetical protein
MRIPSLVLLLVLAAACGGSGDSRHGIGGSCVTNGDCHTGLVCVGDDPGGQCTIFCTDDGQCGVGYLCDPEGKCYQACHTTADCPRAAMDPRYGCVGDEPRRFCDAVGSGDGGETG